MRRLRLGTVQANGTIAPASELAAAILEALADGDEDRQRNLLAAAALLDEGDVRAGTRARLGCDLPAIGRGVLRDAEGAPKYRER